MCPHYLLIHLVLLFFYLALCLREGLLGLPVQLAVPVEGVYSGCVFERDGEVLFMHFLRKIKQNKKMLFDMIISQRTRGTGLPLGLGIFCVLLYFLYLQILYKLLHVRRWLVRLPCAVRAKSSSRTPIILISGLSVIWVVLAIAIAVRPDTLKRKRDQ